MRPRMPLYDAFFAACGTIGATWLGFCLVAGAASLALNYFEGRKK